VYIKNKEELVEKEKNQKRELVEQEEMEKKMKDVGKDKGKK